MQPEHLACLHPALVAEQLGQIAQAPPGLQVADRRPKHPSLSRSRSGQTNEELYRRSFPGTVWSEETKDLGATHAHRQAAERDRLAVALGEVLGVDGKRGGIGRLHRVQIAISGGTLQWRAPGRE